MQNLPPRLIEVFAILGLFLLVLFTTYINGNGGVPVLLVGGFMAAAYKIIPGIVKILNSMEQVKTYSFTVRDLLAEEAGKRPTVTPRYSPVHSIEMKNVHFSYAENRILANFCMQLQRGDFAGLAGPSGQGKTTLVHLLLGFLQPQQGDILLNGQPTTMIRRQESWPRISYIKQQSFFIHDTVMNNITLEEEIEKEKLQRVAELTGVDEVVAGLPGGMNGILSENGKNVSGGQRQRIVLARALYKEADLVILDEPFNELDRVSEDRMLNHFRELAASGKMVLLITHNRESLSFCNKIITIDET
jgi:ABC-type bacteriocin/lantibiotic exporter with double-glycine peptidase domain